jgi:UDP-glucose 4,6-dehydratase
MIALLGATGYVGAAFARALEKRRQPFAALSRRQLDYTRYDVLVRYLRDQRPAFLINAAGYTGKPNVDACEQAQADTLQGNVLLPLTISHACAAAGVPWGHVSSGCIYNGAVVAEGGAERTLPDLNSPDFRRVLATSPAAIRGFRETDEPNFSFRRPPCSFYSGAKALAEESLLEDRQVYLWRLRIPFNHLDSGRNYLSKLQRYPKVYDNINSLSHLDDFVGACLALWERRADYGTYNVTNHGYVSARQVVELISKILRPARQFEFWAGDEEFYSLAAITPRSNCILNTDKLAAGGVELRPVEEAITDALSKWERSE